MKKLVCILLVIVTIMNLAVTSFAYMNLFCPIEIRPKHDEPLPGRNTSLYYGFIDLEEKFNLDILSYTAIADYDVTNVKIETDYFSGCNVSGNKEYDLAVGKNVISIVVTQPDNTSKTYTVTITRKPNPDDDNNLASLSIFNGSSSKQIRTVPELNSNILNYSANVTNDVDKVNISYKKSANGNILYKDYTLKPGDNKIEIPLISNSGIETVYTFNINREKSSYNSFGYIDIEEYDKNNVKFLTEMLGNSDDPKKLVKNVSYDAYSVNLAVVCITNSDIKVTGGGLHSLKVGTNVFNITIEAENGDKRVYTVKINRLKPSAKLESLQINQYSCGTEQTPFTLDVNYSTTKANILGTAENTTAKVIGNGNYNLKVGTNKFIITVKAADGTTKKYPLVINRLKQKNVKVLVIWTIVD